MKVGEIFKKYEERGEKISISGFNIARARTNNTRLRAKKIRMQNVEKNNAASRDYSAFEIVELRGEEEEEAKRRGQKPASSENKNTRLLGFLEKLVYPFRFARVLVFFVLFKVIALVLSGFTWIPILLPINGYYDERKASKAAGIEV